MNVTAAQLLQVFDARLGHRIGGNANAQGKEGLLQVKAHSVLAEDFLLHSRHRLDDVRRQQVDLGRHSGQLLHSVDHKCGGGVH